MAKMATSNKYRSTEQDNGVLNPLPSSSSVRLPARLGHHPAMPIPGPEMTTHLDPTRPAGHCMEAAVGCLYSRHGLMNPQYIRPPSTPDLSVLAENHRCPLPPTVSSRTGGALFRCNRLAGRVPAAAPPGSDVAIPHLDVEQTGVGSALRARPSPDHAASPPCCSEIIGATALSGPQPGCRDNQARADWRGRHLIRGRAPSGRILTSAPLNLAVRHSPAPDQGR
ncbi:hypothetical protein VTJ04DRAFT_5615 [Mycothermus thermophilus]|uniref:uncharacterized protein n=1 Tax=Humicola insolens TaxID=85995 RepID=UPI0037447049